MIQMQFTHKCKNSIKLHQPITIMYEMLHIIHIHIVDKREKIIALRLWGFTKALRKLHIVAHDTFLKHISIRYDKSCCYKKIKEREREDEEIFAISICCNNVR